MNYSNYNGLMEDLQSGDSGDTGVLDSESFVRCLSKNHMKIGENEKAKLIENLKSDHASVNYKDFLKYSYLAHLYLNHTKLEYAMRESDTEGKDQILVAQLDNILQSNNFGLPPTALDTVFQEMLQCNMDAVDRNCIIKIEPFLESLRQ